MFQRDKRSLEPFRCCLNYYFDFLLFVKDLTKNNDILPAASALWVELWAVNSVLVSKLQVVGMWKVEAVHLAWMPAIDPIHKPDCFIRGLWSCSPLVQNVQRRLRTVSDALLTVHTLTIGFQNCSVCHFAMK